MAASVELHWIPLGAGARVVRLSGRTYERLVAARQRRRPAALFHAALVAHLPGDDVTIEMTPVPGPSGRERRGVVAEGPVGMRWLGRWRVFRYEIRCWSHGRIPDLGLAAGHETVTDDLATATRLIESVGAVPTYTWGRDELGVSDMWNSNSVVAWVLATNGVLRPGLAPPSGGRAPGWQAGEAAAARSAR